MNQEIIETDNKEIKVKKVNKNKIKKPKFKLTTKKKKMLKWVSIGSVGACSLGVLTGFTFNPGAFGGDANDPTVFWVSFLIGFLFTLWYPVSRLLAWIKTRKLKNQNLSKDLELKDAKIALYASKTTPTSSSTELPSIIIEEE